MAELCPNCSEKITIGGVFGKPNDRLAAKTVAAINLVYATEYEGLCDRCGADMRDEAMHRLKTQMETLNKGIEQAMAAFPLLTVDVLPGANHYRALGMVTGNVTVGTGLFNEFGQGISDMFGTINQQSGMALKVNKGEAAARAIIVQKAVALGANCIIGVDIDYGITTNNAATVNMQGTAVFVPDLAAVFNQRAADVAEWLAGAMLYGPRLKRWLDGNIRGGEVFDQAESFPKETKSA
jgi:uncharacterized protein YbjQ (UPF0145 family)